MIAGLSLFATGCGGDGLGRRYPVTGTVTYRNLPVRAGIITFHPSDPEGRVAAGTITDGSYRLATLGDDDGALPGSYTVTVVAKEAGRPLGGPVPGKSLQAQRAAATKTAKNLVPAKYQSTRSSGLTREVEAKHNRFDFELVD